MYIRVVVFPDAKKENITKVSDTRFEISVKEPAQQNLANRRVQALLAREFGVVPRDFKLVSGHRSRVKMFFVEV